MRNYISAWWLRYILTDGSSSQFDTVFVGKSLDDVKKQNEAFLASLNPASGPYSFSDQSTLQAYHLLDRQTFMNILNVSPFFWWFTSVRETNPASQNILTLLKTPRYTGWKDQSGGVRRASPSDKKEKSDFSGATTLFESVAALLQLATNLTKIGEVRQAGIVLYAYQQIIRQAWSITEAIQYLVDNRIVGT